MSPDELEFAEREKNYSQIIEIHQDVPSYIPYGNVNNVVFERGYPGTFPYFRRGFARKDLDREVFLNGETTEGTSPALMLGAPQVRQLRRLRLRLLA